MSYSTITNEKRAVFVNVPTTSGSTTTYDYKRMGEGINTFTPANNGTISTKHYINDKFATSRRNGLQKQWSFSGDRVVGDDVNDYLVSLSEKTGSDVETTMIIADMVNPTAGTSGVTYYAGKKYDVMIDVSNDGSIEGGQDVAIDGTFYGNGDPADGYLKVTVTTGTTPTTTYEWATSTT